MRGTVKHWVDDRGFGFIKPDDGPGDVFVHVSGLVGSADRLKRDQVVEFETALDQKSGRPRALNVRVI